MEVEELLRQLKLCVIAAIDEYGNTALHLAVKNKTFTQKKIVEVLGILLDMGINPNTGNKKNETVLQLAVAYRMKDVVHFLMSRKINMDSIPHFFIVNDYLMIQEKLAHMDNLNGWNEILGMQAVSADFAEWLILKGFDFDCKNQENRSALSMAIEYNLQHILPVLLKYTKDINFIDIAAIDKDGNTALHLTIQNKSYAQEKIVEVTEVLIGRGSNPNSTNNKNQTALHLAVLYKMKDVISCLMAHKVNLDLVAHFFVEHEYLTFQELFAQMDNLDEWYGEMLRMETESIEFAEWLISKGIDFDCKNQENQSALYMAVEHNLQHILPVLLKYTKDINFVNKENKTLLHLFLQKNFTSTYYHTKSINKNWYANRYASETVRILLERGVSADAEDKSKMTPIQIAITKEENIDVIQALIEQCLNIHRRCIYDETMFQAVVRYCLSSSESRSEYYLKILGSLVAKGADVNEVYELDQYGYTALCFAVADQNMLLSNFLGENGADFSITTKDGRNLFHLLAATTVTKVISDDMEVEVNVAPHEFVFLNEEAIESTQHIAVVQTLAEHGVEVGRIETRGHTAAIYVAAVKKGDLSLMISLEKNGINFNVTRKHKVVVPKFDNPHQQESIHVLELSEGNEENYTLTKKRHQNLLHRFTKSKNTGDNTNTKLFDLLISKGVQLNAKDVIGNTPLHEAVSHDNETLVQKLIEHGADVNCKRNDGMTPLHVAAFGRANMRLLKLLRNNGADVNLATTNGETLMHLMLKYSEDLKYDEDYETNPMETFHWLINQDCQVNVKDNAGTTPLHVAAEHASDLVVQMLIENGAHVNSRNNRRETPLHCAVKNRLRRAKVSKFLLKHGANVNARDSKGRTALHKIAMEFESGFLEMLGTLLEYGADITALDAEGLSALNRVSLREHEIRIDKKYRDYFHELYPMRSIPRTVGYEFFVLEFSEDEGWHFMQKHFAELYISEDAYGEERVYPDYPRDGCNYNVKISFLRHSMKLKAANFPWIELIYNDLAGPYDLEMTVQNRIFFDNYYKDCLTEIRTLKDVFIDDHTSFYALLHTNLNRRCAYVHNKMLRSYVHQPRYGGLDKYFVLISACYHEAVTRKSLLKPAREAWLELTNIYLPVEILEFIFSFLSNADLFDIIEKN